MVVFKAVRFCLHAATIMFIIFALTHCSKTAEKDATSNSKKIISDRPIKAVTTIGMISDIVENVGGNRVQVTGLMGPGIDPHLYKASEGDVSRMYEADIIFYNGLHLEGKMTEIFDRMQGRVKTVAVTDGIDRSLLLSSAGFKGSYDPHVWFDVTLWMKATIHIRNKLSEFDPGSTELYRKNSAGYLEKLSVLHEAAIKRSRSLPSDKRVLITAHDAFHYFGEAYGFEVHGLQGISTAAEAGTSDVQELAELIVSRKIPAIFIETSVPPRFIEALQAAVKSRGFDVKVGGHLYSDAMGNPGTPDGTYIGMVRHNINTIVKAISGR